MTGKKEDIPIEDGKHMVKRVREGQRAGNFDRGELLLLLLSMPWECSVCFKRRTSLE